MLTGYFRRLRDLSDYVNEKVKAEKVGTVEYNRWFECQKVLGTVIKYALSYGQGVLNDKIMTFWKTNCSYSDTAEITGDSYEGLRSSLARASRILYDKLGATVLDLLKEGKPIDAHIEFMVRSGSLVLEDIIPQEIASSLPKPTYNPTIEVEDCVAELKLLKSLTMVSILKQINDINTSKLAHLLAIMGGDSDYSSMVLKKKLWGYVIGKEELKAMLNDLKVKNLIQ